jgi:mannose-6-phosphate isomerase-like protein (cupin superfamily)
LPRHPAVTYLCLVRWICYLFVTMSNPIPASIITALPSNHQVIRAFGSELIIHLSTQQTGGRCTMLTSIQPPGVGPPPHFHRNEDEWFFVLDGPTEFFNDGAWVEVPQGTAVFVPKEVVQCVPKCRRPTATRSRSRCPWRNRDLLCPVRGGICQVQRSRHESDHSDQPRTRH